MKIYFPKVKAIFITRLHMFNQFNFSLMKTHMQCGRKNLFNTDNESVHIIETNDRPYLGSYLHGNNYHPMRDCCDSEEWFAHIYASTAC